MSVVALVIDVAFVCCLATLLLHRYGDWRKQHLLVTLAAFVSWYFSFMIIFVLPLDVSNTCYRQCILDHTPQVITTTTVAPGNESQSNVSTTTILLDTTLPLNTSANVTQPPDLEKVCRKPWSYVSPDIWPIFWHVVYWTSQVLTWLILPMMQSYAKAGDFSVAGKFKSALIENAIYYGTYLLIFGVCLIYVAVKPNIHLDGNQLKVLAITASNTWGLFLLVLLLGYGLVDVPRTCWNNSRRGYMLQQTYFKIAKLSTEKSEAEENQEDVLEDVRRAADTIRYNNALRKHVDTILEKCPESLRKSVQRNKDDFEDFNNPTETPTVRSLVRLHKKVISAAQMYRRTQCQWTRTVEQALELEDLSQNESSSRQTFVRSNAPYEGIFKCCYHPTLEWYWKCRLRPWGLRMLTALIIVFGLMVVWSECLFFVRQPVLSLFAIFLELARKNYDYVMIEFVCFITVAFLSYCAYYTIFKIRIFNYYYLASSHQTDANSLIFCGMLLCRLTPPLCLNFLGLIHLDTHVAGDRQFEETFYTQIMGHMDVIPFISKGFNIYFPIAIVLLCIATYFHLWRRALHCLGFQQFVGDDDITQELVDEGRELVRREKRRMLRIEETEARRRNWNERFSDRSMSQRDSESDTGSGRKRPAPSKGAKSPTENDRTELLKQVEPVDYTSQSAEQFDDFTPAGPSTFGSVNRPDPSSRYQTQPVGQPPASRFGSTTPRPSVPPPRGIFDDV